MNQSKISVRYARALFESALEKDLVEKIDRDMRYILAVCDFDQVKEVLKSPIIVPSKKTEILHNLFGDDLHFLTRSLIGLTVRNGRERSLPDIARVYIHETMAHNGTTETILTTAVQIDPAIKNNISEMVSRLFKTKVDLKEVVDEGIIGGFILKVDDNYFDASVRNKLRKIRKELAPGGPGTEV